MPRRRATELELGPEVDVAALTGAVPAGRPATEDRTYVDTFDGRLHAAGVVAAEGDRVDPAILGNRALLPLVRVRSAVTELVVLGPEDKTVVRLVVREPEVVTGRGRVALPRRVEVREVLGYAKSYDRAAGALAGADGVREPAEPLVVAAAHAAGRDPAGVSSKVKVTIEEGTHAGAAAAVLLLRLADVAEANVPGTLDDIDVEFLHDLRVAVRRARSVLRELRDVLPATALAHVREELRWVQAATGPVRDLDVQLEDLDGLASGLDAARRDDLGPVRAELLRRRAAAFAELRRTLRGRRFAEALAAWRALAEAATGPQAPEAALRPVEQVAAERIRRVHRRMVRDGGAITDASPDEELHDLRKRGKELRYLLELFGQLFPAEVVKPMVRALKDLQDVLGRFQDRAVQADLLAGVGEAVARRRGGPAALMALGVVVEELHADQARARQDFEQRFARFAADDQRALVKEAFPA